MEKADHLPSFEKTRQLVRVALSEGAHLKPPRFVSRPKWQREIEFVKLGVSFVGGSRFQSTQFWTVECPVSIFQHRSYSYPVEQEQVLWQYLQTKYAKLRDDIIGPNETSGYF